MAATIKGGSPQVNNNSTSYAPTLQIKSDANGAGFSLANTNTTAIVDCASNKLQIAYTNTTNGSSTVSLAPNRLDFNNRIYIGAADAQYQIRSTAYPNSYANLFVDGNGGNLNMSNTAGTCKMTLNMNNSDAVWKREWTTGTSYAREIRIGDDDIALTGPLTINGKLTGLNVQLPGEVRMFYHTDFITGHPTNRFGVILGAVEIDRNAMVLRIKAFITERTGSGSSTGSWSTSQIKCFTPAEILTACGCAATYKFDVSRLKGGVYKGSAQEQFTGYMLGTALWNYTTGSTVTEHQRRGAFILYRQCTTKGYCTINRSTNADGASDFAGRSSSTSSYYDRAVSIAEMFYDNGITIDITLPISEIGS